MTPAPTAILGLIAFLFALGVSPGSSQAQPLEDPAVLVALAGTVKDRAGKALKGVTVEVRERLEVIDFGRTNDEGRFEIRLDVRPGQYTVVALRAGKVVAEDFVTIPPLKDDFEVKLVVGPAKPAAPAGETTPAPAPQPQTARQPNKP